MNTETKLELRGQLMNSPYYVVLYLACEALCLTFVLVMAGKMNTDIGSAGEVQLFRRLSLCSVLEAASESFWMLSKSLIPGMSHALLSASCLGDLLSTGYIVSSWYLFLDYKITPRDHLLKRSRWMSFGRVLPILVLSVVDCSSLITHQVFYVTESGAYVRGEWYPVHAFLCFFYFALVVKLLSEGMKYSTINRQEWRLYLQFSLLLVAGGILQILAGYVPFTLLFFTFGMFMIFSSLQSRQIDTDALTKLNNHTRGFAWIHDHIPDADQKPFYLFMADIDGFKKINDSYGHIQGDEAIILTAETLKKLSESYPSLFLSRFGGDEFLFGVMCEEAQPHVLIQKFSSLLSQALDHSCLPFRFSMSVGYTRADQTDATERELIAEADRELYLQKSRIYHGSDPLQNTVSAKSIPVPPIPEPSAVISSEDLEQYILSHLDEALEKNWIIPYFQPLVRTITEHYSGAEALARWIDPVYGNIMPGIFVPILEKAGMIYKIDCSMIESVLKAQRMRLDAGLPVSTVSINLSRQDFEKQDMISFLREQTSRYRISKDLIALELTESLLVQSKEKMTSIVKELHDDGFQIWMDDFGSGYSSLIFLNDYQLDLIKFDMGFLRSFSRTSREIMRSTVNMAKNLGIRTLAEGAETEEQVSFLKEIGCDLIQGYYYAKPLPTQQLQNYLEHSGRPFESIEWKQFYDEADTCVINSDTPRAVMEYDIPDDHIHYLFINQKQKEELQTLGRSQISESEFVLNNRNTPMHAKMMAFYRQAIETSEQVTSYVSDNSCFLRLNGRIVARKGDRCIILLSMVNVTRDRLNNTGEVLNKSLSDISLLFDDVHVLNPSRNTADYLINNMNIGRGYNNHDNLRQGLNFFGKNLVHPEDQKRYEAFADPDTMVKRIQQAEGGILRDFFRVLLPDNHGQNKYMWKEFDLLLIPGSDDEKVLSCIKSIDPTAGGLVFQENYEPKKQPA